MVSRLFRTASAVTAGVILTATMTAAQSSDYKAPRTPYGNPDLNGIWQSISSANWDIEGHAARHGAIVKLGALDAVPAGLGIVEGGEIPYQDWALEKRNHNRENRVELDPAIKCYMPGIPRANDE